MEVYQIGEEKLQCGDVNQAEFLFNTSSKKTVTIYGAMMKGYIENNQATKAIHLFHKIKDPNYVIFILLFNSCAQLGSDEGLNLTKKVSKTIPKSFYSNVRLLTSILDALVKCNDLRYAQSFFDASIKNGVGMYAVMMNGYNKENNPLKTLNLFYQMKDKNHSIIYLHVIKALSLIGDYKLSQSIIEQIPNDLLNDNQIQTVLIDMWGKSGSIDKVKEIFDKISQPDQYQYASIINAYGLNGMGIQAIDIYRQISLDLIDAITHTCILNACSHSGLVQEARSIFENIQIKTVSIYTTMIDCLSRASLFQEAQNLQEEYERSHPPSLPMYMALLSGARNRMNANLAQQIYDRMNKVFPQSDDSLVSAATLLANVYGSIGDIDKASDIRIQLTKSGAKKKSGLSWTVVDGQVYQFRAHGVNHPRSKEIHAEAEKISAELVEHGHQHDSILCGHSERLAIAWNFVVHPNASQIQITKNLRVCGDCYRATKLIATIRQCEIIVRDANRIHHFYKNGQCSCNDYF
ncbi:unnamed protein product [Rotaria socialis]|uniref:DYW domain-containing protein n=2 Tax=Rotaria socialis TaxID=392032 RepID=A0A820STE8_9BILA|nr:unnamed protein product [Rotaria socialis]